MKKALSIRASFFSSILFQGNPRTFIRKLCFSLFFIPVIIYSQPDWSWTQSVNTTQDEFVNEIAVDKSSGELIAVGVFNSDISAFYGANFAGAIGGGFVAKYNAAGNVLWAFRIGNNQDDACNGVATDASGNIYVTGYFQNIADFKGTSAGSTILTAVGAKDAFIAKYNSAGQLVWVKSGGGANNDEGKSVCVNYNTVFITGYFNSSATFGALSTPAAFSNDNTFITAYDYSGNELWLGEIGSLQPAYGMDVTADSNNVFLGGVFKAATASVYNAAGAVAFTLSNAVPGQNDGYVVSYTSAGAGGWAQSIHSSSDDAVNSIAESGTAIFISGYISNPATFPAYASNPLSPSGNGREVFVASFQKSNGNTSWALSEFGSNGDQEALGICSGLNNEVFVSGYFSNSITFGGTTTLVSAGTEDVFIAAYSTAGVFQRVYQAASSGSDKAPAIDADLQGNLYTGGHYENLFTAGTLSLSDNSLTNAFVAQIACLPLVNTISSSQTICTGSIPATITGNSPTGGMSPFTYLWQESTDNILWTNAAGINNAINYSPPALTATTHFRRIATAGALCSNTDTSAIITITVDQMPSAAYAGVDQTVCADSAFLDATTPASGSGSWSVFSGTGTFQNSNSDTSDVFSMTYGVNSFIWTITNGVCPASKDTVTVTAQALPDTAEAGSDFNLCSSSTALNADAPSVGNGTWNALSAGTTILSPSSPNSSVSGLSSGQNVFEWVVANGICPVSRDTIVITVDDMPDTAAAGNDQLFCDDSTSLSANTPLTGTGTWSFDSGSGTFSNVNSATAAVTNLMNGINVLVWTISNGTCPPSSDTLVVRAFSLPTVANAGADQNICSYSSTLNANTAISGNGSWLILTAGPVLSSSFIPSANVSSLITGQNIFVWQITNGVCAASSDTIIIVVDTLPTIADAGLDQSVCGDSAVLSANSPAIGFGNWTVLAGSGNFSGVSNSGSAVNAMTTGTNLFVWTISNGVCPSSADTVQVNSFAQVTAANAGPDQTICSDSTSLNANNPSSGNGVWNLISAGAILADLSSSSSSVTGLVSGQNNFEWIISNGVCPDSRDTIVVTVDAVPTVAMAGTDQNVCGDSIMLNANNAITGSGMWSLYSGGGNFSTAATASSSVTGMNSGANIFVWTITNGVCPPSSDTVVINSFASVTNANAGSDTIVCDTSLVLNANNPSSGSGNWNVLSAGSNLSFAAATNPTAFLITGQNIFEWVVSNGVCPDSRDTVLVISDTLPDGALAGVDQTICGDTASLNANNPQTGTGVWTVFSGAGSFSNAQSNTSAVTSLSPGTNAFLWTIINGVCPASTDTVKVISFSNVTTAQAGSDQQICSASATLTANTPLSGNGSWNVITSGPVLSSSTAPVTNADSLQVGQNSFEWVISNGICPDSRDTVIIIVDANPSAAIAGADDSICGTLIVLNAAIPVTGSGSWSVLSGTGTFSDLDSASTSVSGLSTGNNQFIWTISNGVCTPVKDTIQIVSLQIPTVANAGTDQQICTSTAMLNANVPVVGTGTWNSLTAGVTMSSAGNPQTNVSSLAGGINEFEWIISNGICPDSRDTVKIMVDALPSVANAGADIVTELSNVQLNANTPIVGNGTWNIIAGEGSFSNVNDPLAAISGLQNGEVIVSWTISSGTCPPSTDTLKIYHNELYIPQVITPNGDGLNDLFEIKAYKGFSGPKFELYNRWGSLVYFTTNYQNNFDGTNTEGIVLAEDTYYYVIETSDDKIYKGYLIIKRK